MVGIAPDQPLELVGSKLQLIISGETASRVKVHLAVGDGPASDICSASRGVFNNKYSNLRTDLVITHVIFCFDFAWSHILGARTQMSPANFQRFMPHLLARRMKWRSQSSRAASATGIRIMEVDRKGSRGRDSWGQWRELVAESDLPLGRVLDGGTNIFFKVLGLGVLMSCFNRAACQFSQTCYWKATKQTDRQLRWVDRWMHRHMDRHGNR